MPRALAEMADQVQYKIVPGYQFRKDKAGVYAEELKRLREETGANLKPREIVQAAEDPTSPLHDAFEWDDTRAAQEWRVTQARRLLRCIHVVVRRGEKQSVRAFFRVIDPSGESGYVGLATVLERQDYRDQIIEQALKEIVAWQGRYRDYQELGSIFGAIDWTAEHLASFSD